MEYGITGERVVNNYKFYAVFQENIEYTVRSGSEELGTIVKPPPAGEKIAIAGRVWAVDEVDHQRREVYCTLVKGNIPAYFGDVAGDIHTRILERMHTVLMPHRDIKPHELRILHQNNKHYLPLTSILDKYIVKIYRYYQYTDIKTDC